MDDLKGKRVLVVGGGSSGVAAANLCLRRGACVSLTDCRTAAELFHLDQLLPEVGRDLGGHSAAWFAGADLLVLSPGVPQDLPLIRQAVARGVPLWGEVELASRFLTAPILAVSGTNGKSTTTCLLGAMLTAAGKRVFVGGNLGTPLCAAVDQPWDALVVELSSFQLETIVRFRPAISVLLNISPDHLDRYADMAAYCTAKGRLFLNQGPDSVLVLNADDAAVLDLADGCPARRWLFSLQRPLAQGLSYAAGRIEVRWDGQQLFLDTDQLQLRGLHNVENVMAALAAALAFGVAPATAWQAACAFRGLPHRMELVRQLAGVRWYNDSKGTNIGSVLKSLAGLSGPITLIAGGKDKGGDYGLLRPLLAQKRPQLVLLGAAAERMAQSWSDLCAIERATSLEQAVHLAWRLTPAGGSVLLSPGCSSFDMFRSFEERGERFVAAVEALPEQDHEPATDR